MLISWLLRQQLTNGPPYAGCVDFTSDSGKTNKETNGKAFNFEVHRGKNHMKTLMFAKQTYLEGTGGTSNAFLRSEEV